MQVIIHTLGRATWAQQPTLHQLLADGICPTLVVQAHEADKYSWYEGEVHVLPDSIRTLAPTRDYIIHDMEGPDKVVFMDDDLHFACRRNDDPSKFRKPEKGDLSRMIDTISRGLDVCPHVGIGAREGGNRVTEEYVWNTRVMRVLAYSRKYLKKRSLYFSPLVVMEDFHMNLQILRSGADSMLCNKWVSNQANGSDAPGGCATYRSDKVQTDSANLLATRHPGFVKVVQKTTKGAWGGGTRTDVVVQWKAARKSAS